jgi:hypothetical protein
MAGAICTGCACPTARCCASSPAAGGRCATCWGGRAGGWAYFSAGGVDGGDPYVRGLYRVSLQGGPVQRLAADGNDHLADAGTGALFGGRAPQALSPGGGYLVDTVSVSTSHHAPCCGPAMTAAK